MAEEITYIPYGLNEISQLDLMTNAANNVESFIQQYKWLLKPKNYQKFKEAYLDIARNLTGASVLDGLWTINTNNIDMDSKSPLEKKIYEHAAFFWQLLMSLMTPRVKEEEKKKEDLTPFKFTTDFNKYLLRGYGNSGEIFADPELGWDAQDARGSNGLRGTEKRRAAMIKALQEYSDSLEDNKYNFEGTQFANLADAKAKIQTAINALKDTPNDESDDLPAFSALGLKYRSYFSNGGNDASGYLDSNGNPLTYTLYLTLLEKLKQEEAQIKLEELKKLLEIQKQKLASQRAQINKYKGIFRYNPTFNWTISNFKANSADEIVAHIKNNFGNISSNDEMRKKALEIEGAYRIADENKKLKEISNSIWTLLLRSLKFSMDSTRGKNKSDFKQIEGIDNIIFDSTTKRIYYLDQENPTKKMLDTVKRYRNKQIKEKTKYLENRYSGPTMITHKQGGQINSLDKIIEDFINNNNI